MNSVSAAKLDSDAPAVLNHALPAWVYSHPDLMRLEIERVLKPDGRLRMHIHYHPATITGGGG